MKGPEWLANYEKWPDDIITAPSKESESEAKMVSKVMATTIERQPNVLDQLLERFSLWKILRITAWMMRFIENTRIKEKDQRRFGTLRTQEIQKAKSTSIKLVQEVHEKSEAFKEDKGRLNLRKNDSGIYICQGRIMEFIQFIYLDQHCLLKN